MDPCFEHPVEMMHGHEKKGVEKLKLGKMGDDHGTGGFDCSICLGLVEDPVVTFCGHLFCWPCIYKWIHVQTSSSLEETDQQPRCPVCKADLSERTLIPLYCGGGHSNEEDSDHGKSIPHRPAAPPSPCGGVHNHLIPATTMVASSPPGHHQLHRRRSYMHHQMQQQQQPLLSGFNSSDSSMFGETIYARIFANQTTPYGGGGYPDSSYHLSGLTSPRIRRRVIQMDRSLSRLSFFLLCFVIFCLLLF
ncbi:hypothetical protein Dimus_009574 [Dionaea muscipula]